MIKRNREDQESSHDCVSFNTIHAQLSDFVLETVPLLPWQHNSPSTIMANVMASAETTV